MNTVFIDKVINDLAKYDITFDRDVAERKIVILRKLLSTLLKTTDPTVETIAYIYYGLDFNIFRLYHPLPEDSNKYYHYYINNVEEVASGPTLILDIIRRHKSILGESEEEEEFYIGVLSTLLLEDWFGQLYIDKGMSDNGGVIYNFIKVAEEVFDEEIYFRLEKTFPGKEVDFSEDIKEEENTKEELAEAAGELQEEVKEEEESKPMEENIEE